VKLRELLAVIVRTAIAWGPLAGLALGYAMSQSGWSYEASATAGLTLLTAAWWIFEPIPIPATSLIPLGLFPLLGLLPASEVARAYGDPLILLLVGGAILSKAMEKSEAHRRVALGMIRLIGGGSSRRVVLGFMAASGLLSMWLSNTATCFMLLPVVMAVLGRAQDPRLATPLLLGVAYAASIGGMATPVGTTPNVIFMRVYEETTKTPVTFVEWMRYGLPVVLIFVPIAGLWLTRSLRSGGGIEIPHPGAWTPAERRVLVIFGLTALAWVTLDAPWGGWSAWLGLPGANLASVALLSCVVLFAFPDGRGGKLLDWDSAVRIHWGVFILFAGGIAIARAFAESGISEALGAALSGLADLHPLVIILVVSTLVTFLTEVTSNTATSTLLMPILAATAVGAELEPRLLMMPAALSASCAFMLPVATAPNAIVFSVDRLKIQEMAREGFVLNWIGVVVISSLVYLTGGA